MEILGLDQLTIITYLVEIFLGIKSFEFSRQKNSSIKIIREFFQFWSFAGWNYSKNGFYQWSIVYIWFRRQKNNWLRSNPWWRYKYYLNFCKSNQIICSLIFRNLYLFFIQKICSWKLWSLWRWISCRSRFWSHSKSKKWRINQVDRFEFFLQKYVQTWSLSFTVFFFVKLQSWPKKWIV